MKSIDPEDRALFLLLFYREHVGRLVGRLRGQVEYKETIKREHKKNTLKEWDATVSQIAEWLAQFIARAEDDSRCNDICKSMYFCDLKRGHRGKHCEGGLLRW